MIDYIPDSRLTVIIGAYGSGKSEISVNMALSMRRADPSGKLLLADMDIVNPYYRSADAADILAENDIRLIRPAYAGSNVDAPVLGGEMYVVFDDRSYKGVFDIGGEDMGAVILGSLKTRLASIDYKLLMAVNINRPFTSTAEQIVSMSSELSEAAGLVIDGYINNTNLLEYTTLENIAEGSTVIKEASVVTGIPLTAVSLPDKLCKDAADTGFDLGCDKVIRLERTIFYNY